MIPEDLLKWRGWPDDGEAFKLSLDILYLLELIVERFQILFYLSFLYYSSSFDDLIM